MAASNIGGNSECEGPMWLLPSTGDNGGNLAGQPLLDYQYPGMHVADNLDAPAQWSPNGTMIALNTMDDATGNAAPFILVAHLTAVKPSQPLPPISSQPGSWAPTSTGYHPATGYAGTNTLAGPGGGKVTVQYNGNVFGGDWSETYANYSDNGRDFVNGTVTINGSAADGTYSSHLTMTGANTGSDSTDINFSHGAKGNATSTYDGHTINGPMPQQVNATTSGGPTTACPNALPKKPALHATATRLGHGAYTLKVTVSIAGVGANETLVDTEPVDHATLTLGGVQTYTDNEGVASITPASSGELTVTAGDTLVPTSVYLQAAGHTRTRARACRSTRTITLHITALPSRGVRVLLNRKRVSARRQGHVLKVRLTGRAKGAVTLDVYAGTKRLRHQIFHPCTRGKRA
jgi:hypothetical protein